MRLPEIFIWGISPDALGTRVKKEGFPVLRGPWAAEEFPRLSNQIVGHLSKILPIK
jgi:hypothetical protein